MDINALLKEREMTKYRLSKLSCVPNTTINDICSGKARIEKCSAETIYKISKVLNITMEELIEDNMRRDKSLDKAVSFELYKSNICHRVKDIGDIPFIVEVLESEEVRKLYEKNRYIQAFYLLGMIDYLSRENDLPVCADYKDIRSKCLAHRVYPQSIIALSLVAENEDIKEKKLGRVHTRI